MADYVEREAAIAAIKKDIMGGLNYESILKRIPSEDVQPVKHGRWENGVTFHKVCSECNCIIEDPAFDEVFFGCGRLNYCPNCGARMEDGK